MFQNSAISSPTVNLPETVQRPNSLRVLRELTRTIPLPKTWQEYLLWVLLMGGVAGMISLQIWLSLQIAQANYTLQSLQTEYTMVEQENAELLWRISQYTALDWVESRATEMGYVPALQRKYIYVDREATFDLPASITAENATKNATPQVMSASSATTAGEQADQTWSLWDDLEGWWQPHNAALQSRWQEWTRSFDQP